MAVKPDGKGFGAVKIYFAISSEALDKVKGEIPELGPFLWPVSPPSTHLSGGFLGFVNSDVGEVPGFVPGYIAGVVLPDPGDDDVKRALTDSARKVVPPFADEGEIFFINGGPLSDLSTWAFGRLSRLCARFGIEAANAQLELAIMRKAFGAAQDSLKRAQDLLARSRDPEPVIAQHVGATEATYGLTQDSLEQVSRREFASVHAFELEFRPMLAVPASPVEIELLGLYSDRELGRWTLASNELRTGWTRFGCDTQAEPLGEPIKLRVRAPGVSFSTVAVALGPLAADVCARAQLSNGHYLDRPLAWRLWEGVPGLDLPQAALNHLPGTLPKPLTNPFAAAGVLQFAVPGPATGAGQVAWDESGRGLLVHPNGRDPVLAVIRKVGMTGVQKLSSTVHLAHPQAQPTEFAIAAYSAAEVQKQGPSRLLSLGRQPDPERLISERADWIRLDPGEVGRVEHIMRKPFTGSADIYLMTRNLGSDSSFCWAFFDDLSVTTAGL